MPFAIRVADVWKQYHIGARADRPRSLHEALTRALRRPLSGRPRHRAEAFWALREISFEVAEGEALGIIGPNGAGKSTLLRLLSRITGPTRGELELAGRVGSLLEVGTGFHPELTGRENVYLNGAILGMTRAEITARFDEIVAFSGVERFLDTPVKRYSHGMYVRLAFAIAAHLEPDILLVDEVLAVGDAAFQRKCLAKMSDVGRLGRTVVFVSHDLRAIRQLCPRALLLSEGRIARQGDARQVIDAYLASGIGESAVWDEARAPGDDRVRLLAVRARSTRGEGRSSTVDEPQLVEVDFRILERGLDRLAVQVHLHEGRGSDVLSSVSTDEASREPFGWFGRPHEPGVYRAVCELPGGLLNSRTYTVSVHLVTYDPLHVHVSERHAVSFEIADSGPLGERAIGGEWRGVVRPRLAWRVEPLG